MEKILILDYGSQYTQLIARRLRELGVFSEIHPPTLPHEAWKAEDVKGVILSGGPESVYAEGAPDVPPGALDGTVPVLGICYGMQLMTHRLGGRVVPGDHREYGKAMLDRKSGTGMLKAWGPCEQVWMSHGDRVEALPDGFQVTGTSQGSPFAAIEHDSKPLLGIQFHPEVVHTPKGAKLLSYFLFEVCKCAGTWTMNNIVDALCAEVKAQVGDRQVLCALSGGVDSSVMALLLHKAIGDRLHCLFIDTGLLRKDEAGRVLARFRDKYHLDVNFRDASAHFMAALAGVSDPEAKRKAIGKSFIEVFQEEAARMKGMELLAQGTIYPDRIESSSIKGPSAVIKSHHNVGGLPDILHMGIVEPLKDLFKDEVRALGRALGLDEELVSRHPFPGPGLAVRIPGAVDAESVRLLQEVDAIYLEEIRSAGLYGKISQAFAVLLPVKTVGVMGDFRTYERVAALRAVVTDDFMTAEIYPFDAQFLARVASRIVNEVRGVNRVVYDITSKPPGTIEWE